MDNVFQVRLKMNTDQILFKNLRKYLAENDLTSFEDLHEWFVDNEITNIKKLYQYLSVQKMDDEFADLINLILERLKRESATKICQLTSSINVANYLKSYYQSNSQEELSVLILDTKNQIIAHELIFKGSLNSSVVHPREIYKQAIIKNASAIIIAHNHPSGDANPSRNDITFSKKMVESGKIIGIDCLDHFIVSDVDYVSLKERNLI